VEVVVPVEDRKLRAEIRTLLNVQLHDMRSAGICSPDGTYVQRRPAEGQDGRGSHEILIDLAEKKLKRLSKLKKKKAKGRGGETCGKLIGEG